jgi:hypothetical protein
VKTNIILSIIFTFALGFLAKAQEDAGEIMEPKVMQTNMYNYIKISPLSLFEPEPSFQIAFAYPISGGNHQIQHEIGYSFSPDLLWKSMNSIWATDITINGIKLRSGIRTYTGFVRPGNYRRNYIAFDAMFKYSSIKVHDMEFSRMGGAYTQIMDIDLSKQVYTFHVLLGRESLLFGNERLMLDYYFGLGYRIKRLNKDKIPSDIALDFDSPFWYDFYPRYSIPSVMLGFKVGYRL